MPGRGSVNHSVMREMNTAFVLNTLCQQAPISRAGLAASTGLTKAAVSSMVRDLLAARLVRETANSAAAEIGRPAIDLEPDPDAGYMIGAEIGVGFVSTRVVNFGLETVIQRQALIPLGSRPEAAVDTALGLLREVYAAVARRQRPIFGLAVGVAGLVDVSTGTLLFAPNLGWRSVPLYDLLRREFDLPIYISNEANLAALGESYFGPPGSSDFLLYISSGVGIGGGIVLNGALLTGPTGFTGEVGHMTVERDGLPCSCGSRGCWETVASQRALFRRVQAAAGGGSLLHELTSGSPDALTVPLVVQAAQRGDAAALAALEETGRWLGVGIASLINIICPRRAVFGGALGLAHAFLLPVIREEVARRAFPHVRDSVEIALATHVADAVVMGGVALVRRDVLNHPMRWL